MYRCGLLLALVLLIVVAPTGATAQVAGLSEARLNAGDLSEDQIRVWRRIGELAARVAEVDPAGDRPDWEAVLAEARTHFREPSAAIAVAQGARAYGLGLTGQPAEANEEMTAALAMLEASPDQEPLQLIEMLWAASEIQKHSGQIELAQASLLRSRELTERHHPEDVQRRVTLDVFIASIDSILGRESLALDRLRGAYLALGDVHLPDHKIIVGMAIANSLTNLNRHSEAARQLHEALAYGSATLGPDHPSTLKAMEILIMIELGRDNLSTAKTIATELLAKRRAGIGLPTALPDTLMANGQVAMAEGSPDAAIGFFLEASQRYAEILGPSAQMATTANVLAVQVMAMRPDRAEEALALIAEAKPLVGEDNLGLLARMHLNEAHALLTLDRPTEALTPAQAAFAQFSQQPAHSVVRTESEILVASIQARLGITEAASAGIHHAIDQLEVDFAAGPTAARHRAGWKASRELLSRIIETAYRLGDQDTAFRALQAAIKSDVSDAASEAWRRLEAEGDPEAVETLRAWRTTTEARRTLDRAHLDNLARADRDAIGRSAQEIDASQAEIDRLEAIIAREHPAFGAISQSRPLTLAEAQARLSPGQAMIASAFAGRNLLTFALTRDGVTWDLQPVSSSQIHADHALLRATTDGPTRDGVDAFADRRAPAAAFDRAAAHRLYRAFFSPTIEAGLGDADELIFVVQPGLNTIPFAALVTDAPEEPTTAAETAWLIRRFAVGIATDVSAVRSEDARLRAPRLFAAGAPQFSGAGTATPTGSLLRGGVVDVEAVKALPALPFAVDEIDALDRAFPGGRVLRGEGATEAAIKAADLTQATVLVFATHGLVAGDFGGLSEPALAFTPPAEVSSDDDGLLTASEAAMLDLDADWVVLSACNTAAGDRPGAAGFTGLARAFLFAGGRNILVSHWPVRDDAAARLTVATIEASAGGQSPARALRTAMLALMDDPDVPNGSDPAVWAPFTLVGS